MRWAANAAVAGAQQGRFPGCHAEFPMVVSAGDCSRFQSGCAVCIWCVLFFACNGVFLVVAHNTYVVWCVGVCGCIFFSSFFGCDFGKNLNTFALLVCAYKYVRITRGFCSKLMFASCVYVHACVSCFIHIAFGVYSCVSECVLASLCFYAFVLVRVFVVFYGYRSPFG